MILLTVRCRVRTSFGPQDHLPQRELKCAFLRGIFGPDWCATIAVRHTSAITLLVNQLNLI